MHEQRVAPQRSHGSHRDRSVKLYTYVLPNSKIDKNTDLNEFTRSVDFLEHWAGFDLWSALPDEVEDFKEGTRWDKRGPLDN